MQSFIPFGVFLSFRRLRSVFSFILFIFYFVPISGKYSSVWSLHRFDHGSSCIFIGILINLLEHGIKRVNSIFFFMSLHVIINFFINFIPILFYFRRRRIRSFNIFDFLLSIQCTGSNLRSTVSTLFQHWPAFFLILFFSYYFYFI